MNIGVVWSICSQIHLMHLNPTTNTMHFIGMNQLFVLFFRNRMKLKKYGEDETKRIEEMNNNYYCVVDFRS
jgi:hypothetical protein